MRVDPTYITNSGWLAGSDAVQRAAVELGAFERREHHVAEPEPGGRGRERAPAQPDSAGRFFHRELEPGDEQSQAAIFEFC